MPSPSVSFKVIAAKCGLSHSAVSKILSPNGHKYAFPESTRAHVLRIARESGYERSMRPAAPGAAPARPQVAFVSNRIPHSLGCYGNFAGDVANALFPLGMDLLLLMNDEGWGQWQRDRREEHLAGAILQEDMAPHVDNFLLHSRLPLVLIQMPGDLPVDRVEVDHGPGIRLASDLVFGLGHRQILFVASFVPRHLESHRTRTEGLKRGAATVGGTVLVADGVSDALAIIDQNPAITAIVLFHEQELPAVSNGLLERGMRVPQDLSLFCCGGASMVGNFTPTPSFLEADWRGMAQAAAEMINDRLNGYGGPPRVRRFTERLVAGRTMAPPRC